jgi:hypothetical protein
MVIGAYLRVISLNLARPLYSIRETNSYSLRLARQIFNHRLRRYNLMMGASGAKECFPLNYSIWIRPYCFDCLKGHLCEI